MNKNLKHTDETCVFCRELSGDRNTNFAKRYPEISTRYIAETDDLVAFPCIGQLTSNHFLIAPKYHVATFSSALRGKLDINAQLEQILNNVHRILNISIADSLIFEHGALAAEFGGCGIYHAHLHVVPDAAHLSAQYLINSYDTQSSQSIFTALLNIPENSNYVLAGDIEKGYAYKILSQPLESQTLRKRVALALERVEWDWRNFNRELTVESMIKTANNFEA